VRKILYVIVIGHIKNDHRMTRNYLSRTSGDATNAIFAAAREDFSLLLLKWLKLLQQQGPSTAQLHTTVLHFAY
jgi:hypothetical protein